MRLYGQIFLIALNQYLVYRLSFILWRFRVVLNVILVYFLWWSVYTGRDTLFGYSQTQMITYVLLTNIVGTIIFASRTTDIAGEILDGTVMNYLTKPLSTMRIFVIKEFADKFLNLMFACVEVVLMIMLLRPSIVVQTDPLSLLFFLLSLVIGGMLAFFMSLTISFVAFWSTEVWAPRFIYFILISFFAGTYFPLDVLPKTLYNLFLLTPFPYFMYLPSTIYLRGMSMDKLILFVPALLWAAAAYFASRTLWHKGLKDFSFYGR